MQSFRTEYWKICSWAFSLIYLAFAGFLAYCSFASDFDIISFLKMPFVFDIYFAGIAHLLLALITAGTLHARFAGDIGYLGIETHKRLVQIGGSFGIFGGILFGFMAFWYFTELTPLFFLLLIVYLSKNTFFIFLGRKKTEILKRYAQTYGLGLVSFGIFTIIYLAFAVVPAVLTYCEWPYLQSVASVLLSNAITIYYLTLAYSNAKKQATLKEKIKNKEGIN